MKSMLGSVYQSKNALSLKRQIMAARKFQERSARKLQKKAARYLQRRNVGTKFPDIAQKLEAQRTHSFCPPENNLYLGNPRKRPHTTKRSKARKRPRKERGPSLDELPISPVKTVEAVSPLSSVSSISSVLSVKTQARAELNEVIRPIQLVRATSESTQVATPQIETQETSNCPIALDDDSEENTDMEDEDEADEPIPNDDQPKEDMNAGDGEKPITNGDSSENMNTEGSEEDMDAEAGGTAYYRQWLRRGHGYHGPRTAYYKRRWLRGYGC
jgi:hypothetical protein